MPALGFCLRLLTAVQQRLLIYLSPWITVERGLLSSIARIRCVAILCPAMSQGDQPYTLGFPLNKPAVAIQSAQPPGRHLWSEFGLYLLPDAHLAGSRAVPLTSTRRLVTEHTGGSLHTCSSQHTTLRPLEIFCQSFQSPAVCLEAAYSISSPFAWNYFHWITDCLPCLHAYEAIPEPATLLLPEGISGWQLESLDLMGYAPGSWVSYLGPHLRVKRLYLSTWPKGASHWSPPHPSLVAWLRERILSAPATKVSGHEPERLFIDRSASSRLRIGNQRGVQRLFEQHGFTPVRLETLSFARQVALFRAARWVAGVHGAGFTNLLFAEGCPRVFEIFPQGGFQPFYANLHQLIGGEHLSYVADRIEDNVSIVDLDQLTLALDPLLGGRDGL